MIPTIIHVQEPSTPLKGVDGLKLVQALVELSTISRPQSAPLRHYGLEIGQTKMGNITRQRFDEKPIKIYYKKLLDAEVQKIDARPMWLI